VKLVCGTHILKVNEARLSFTPGRELVLFWVHVSWTCKHGNESLLFCQQKSLGPSSCYLHWQTWA